GGRGEAAGGGARRPPHRAGAAGLRLVPRRRGGAGAGGAVPPAGAGDRGAARGRRRIPRRRRRRRRRRWPARFSARRHLARPAVRRRGPRRHARAHRRSLHRHHRRAAREPPGRGGPPQPPPAVAVAGAAHRPHPGRGAGRLARGAPHRRGVRRAGAETRRRVGGEALLSAALALAVAATAGGVRAPERLTAGTGNQFLGTLSPDRASLYFVSDEESTTRIYVQDVARGIPRLLFEDMADVTWPRPSPDGKRLLYISYRTDAA